MLAHSSVFLRTPARTFKTLAASACCDHGSSSFISSSGRLKVDVHTHILPRDWPDLAAKYGYGGFIRLEHHANCNAKMMMDDKFFREVEPNCFDAEERLIECDRDGVNVQVLSTVPVMFCYWAKPEHTHDLSRFLNDHLAGVVKSRPDRFVGLGTLPMNDTERAVQELTRCVKDLGMAGVQIGSHVNGAGLDDPALFPIFEAAAELGACVFVHPWDMMGGPRLNKYWLSWLVGMPAESAAALSQLILGGVLHRLPNLRLGVAHCGGSFLGTIGRIEHGFNVRPDLCAVDCDVNPRDFLGRFYVDALTHDAGALSNAVSLMGANRVMMGSDYPFPLGEHLPGSLIESMPEFDEGSKRLLLSDTALEFLGLEQQREFFLKAGQRSFACDSVS